MIDFSTSKRGRSVDKLGKMLRAKLRARRNDSINAERRRNRNADRVNSVNCMITPQISAKCIAPQARHFPKKRTASNVYKLPAIGKPHAGQEASANDKENIHPSAYFNSSSNDYYGVSLSGKLNSQARKRLNALPSGRNQSIEAKGTKLTLPDDSNYEKIVSFVKDIKDTMAARSEHLADRTMTPCNEARRCAHRPPKQGERGERLHDVAVVDPLRSSVCELPRRASLRLEEDSKDKETEEMLKKLTLWPVMRLNAGEEQIALALQDPFYII